MKLADYVISTISGYGIKDIFVVYGAANGDLIDAFVRNKDTRYVAMIHEQGAGFAAEGYAKISGKFGVAIATSGPGGMNFVTSIGNCFYDSVPCLFITGQVKTQYMRPSSDIRQVGFQETDIVSIVSPITKYAKLITDPNNIRYELEKAILIATSGRPGPVLLDLPINIQKTQIDPSSLKGLKENNSSEINNQLIEKGIESFLNDLKNSHRPCILVGGGVRMSNALEEFLKLARELAIPCFPTWNALDTVCSDFEYYGGRVGTYGGPGRNFGIQNSDLLLAIGSRVSGRITGGDPYTFARGAKKYIVDIDKPALNKKYQQLPFDVCIHSDAKFFMSTMLRMLKDKDPAELKVNRDSLGSWMNKVERWREKYDPVNEEMFESSQYLHPYAFLRILSEEMSNNDVIIGDCGGNIVALNHAFKTKTGQRYLTNNGNSPMGFSFAGAIGAWLASDRNQNVVCVIGDGGFNMNIQELQILVNYKVKIKTIILNNHIYGITKAFQETNFQGRSEACGPKGYNPPDFIKICEAYRVNTMVIDDGSDYEKVRQQIREFLDNDGPIVCDVNCHDYHTYDPKIVGWSTPIEDMYPYLPREEFYMNMSVEPLEISKDPPVPSIHESQE